MYVLSFPRIIFINIRYIVKILKKKPHSHGALYYTRASSIQTKLEIVSNDSCTYKLINDMVVLHSGAH